MIRPLPAARGFTLVIVLLGVVLMTVLAVAFFASGRTETMVTRASVSGRTARDMADVAVQCVVAQIEHATTYNNKTGGKQAWASQPGMIRSYDAAGNAAWFKLYSAQTMIQTSAAESAAAVYADLPAGAWASPASPQYGVFTDLNAPLQRLDASGNATLVYPIFDPASAQATASAPAEPGCALDASSVPGYDAGSAPSAVNNPAAMPVRWLYVLADGTLVPAVAGASPGSFSIPGASKSNPVIGRVAFWADDDTCKVNVNTAADASYWDTPRFNNGPPAAAGASVGTAVPSDATFALCPPTRDEYARFVGNPAQTKLAWIANPPAAASPNAYDLTATSRAMAGVTPFVPWGASEGGTVPLPKAATTAPAVTAPARMTPYASVDEWMFSTAMAGGKRTANVFPGASGASTSPLASPSLQRLRFFLTAFGAAPEVNLFGGPRLAIWPIDKDLATNPASPYTTLFDRLVAQASRLTDKGGGTGLYYFQRAAAGEAGAGARSQTADYSGIARNPALFAYLQKLAGTAIPGYGGTFAAKYGADGDQILTEIFDYIRATNPYDPQLAPATYSATAANHAYTQLRDTHYDAAGSALAGAGQVTPIRIGANQGFGCFPTVSEVAFSLAFDTSGWTADNPVGKVYPSLFFSLFSPSAGPPRLLPDVTVEVDGLSSLTCTAAGVTTAPFASNAAHGGTVGAISSAPGWSNGGTDREFLMGGPIGFRPLCGFRLIGGATPYAFTGAPVTIPVASKTATASAVVTLALGAPLTVKIFTVPLSQAGHTDAAGHSDGPTAYATADSPVQTLTIPAFSAAEFAATSFRDGTTTHAMGGPVSFSNRLWWAYEGPQNDPGNGQPLQWYDWVRAMAADDASSGIKGDLRLLAAQAAPPASTFVKHPAWGTQQGNTIRDLYTNSAGAPGAVALKPPNGLIYPTGNSPAAFPFAIPASGDWDNGPGVLADGPYINKPDEGIFFWGGAASVVPAPYYGGDRPTLAVPGGYASPSRTVASAVEFGSLPTGVVGNVPWRTLLFHPQAGHFGAGSPADFLLLDWFWMPVVGPVPLAGPLATAGKVNLNYQLVPFGRYLTRSTALQSVLASERVVAIPTGDILKYKALSSSTAASTYRWPLNLSETDGTLRAFAAKFASGQVFKSAAEICGVYLVPAGQSWSSDAAAEAWWSGMKLTGDNTRERPYNGLYPRLTTKSNVFTVHVRAQALRPSQADGGASWTEAPERVVSEYRGLATIERYLDPADAFPDFASASDSLDNYYRYRVVETRRFQP